MNIKKHIKEKIKYAFDNNQDELDFFLELKDENISLVDIKNNCSKEFYEYSKNFTLEHGLE